MTKLVKEVPSHVSRSIVEGVVWLGLNVPPVLTGRLLVSSF